MASRKVLGMCLMALMIGVAAAAKSNAKANDKLVDLIKKKQLEAMVEQLHKEGMDVNQPDSKGRLALVEAVRAREIKLVDALLQYGALSKSKDPSTGVAPIQVAFQHNMPQIARMLLQYGADINVDDKSGKKARDFAPSQDIRDLIAAYDKEGSVAFEDAPGTWTKQVKGAQEEYWFNIKTSEARWNLPASCAWQRVEVQGHPIKYINSITGQEMTIMPPSLAWVKVRSEGQLLYYNWKVNVSQLEVPQEVPQYMLEDIDKNVNLRWHNEKTGELSWTNPAYSTAWRELAEDETGTPYWYNVETGESVWDMPAEVAWTKVPDEETGSHFYFNRLTKDSTWEAPDHLAWVRHDSDL